MAFRKNNLRQNLRDLRNLRENKSPADNADIRRWHLEKNNLRKNLRDSRNLREK